MQFPQAPGEYDPYNQGKSQAAERRRWFRSTRLLRRVSTLPTALADRPSTPIRLIQRRKRKPFNHSSLRLHHRKVRLSQYASAARLPTQAPIRTPSRSIPTIHRWEAIQPTTAFRPTCPERGKARRLARFKTQHRGSVNRESIPTAHHPHCFPMVEPILVVDTTPVAGPSWQYVQRHIWQFG